MDEDAMRMVAETHNMEKVQLRMRVTELEAALQEIDRVENERTIPDRHGTEIESCNTTCLQECGAIARKALRK